MKKIKTLIFMLIIMIFLVPTFSMAAEFACSQCNPDYGVLNRGLGAIWHAMRLYGDAWLDTDIGNHTGEWGSEFLGQHSLWDTDDDIGTIIHSRGGICFGHVSAYGTDTSKVEIAVLDIGEEIKRYKVGTPGYEIVTNEGDKNWYYKGAYFVEKATKNQETSNLSNYKKHIRGWLDNEYLKLGINRQTPSGDATINDFSEADAYANSLTNSETTVTFSTTSKDEEGARQAIEEKTINGKKYTFIGPYNLNHQNGSVSETAEITTREGGKIKTSLCSTNGTNIKNLGSLEDYSGDDFYIVSENEVSSVDHIDLKKTYSISKLIRARIVLASPIGGGGAQNIGVFYGKELTGSELQNYVKSKSIDLTLPGVRESKIKIIKKNSATGETMNNIGLVLYSEEAKGYVRLNGTKVEYVANINDATIHTTKGKGEVTVEKLTKKGKYVIYEVVHPGAPDNGFEEVSKSKPLKVGEVTVSAIGTNAEITIYNTQKYIKVSGFVWEDRLIEDGKELAGNLIYKENENDKDDKLVQNVTVNLKHIDGRTIDTKTTNSNGQYQFTKVLIDDLNKYYIEFTYNGMSYQCVSLINLSDWNTSKAAESGRRQTFNNKFKVITNNNANGDTGDISLKYDGITNHRSTLNFEGNPRYGYTGATYPINNTADKYLINANTRDTYNGCLDKIKTAQQIKQGKITELTNINLGLVKREQPDLSVKKDIKNVKILVNGKGQIYEYDKRFSHMNESAGDGYDLGVKFGNKYGKMKYTRPIYKADVTFESADKSRELQLYLTYAIGIKNNSSNISAEINQIVDFYDKRYAENSYGAEIKVGTGLTEDATITNEIAFKDLGNNHNANKNEYNKMEIDTSELGRIEKQSFKTVYVQFKLSRELVYEILGEEGTTQEPLDNVTEITSYSIFDQNGAVYAGIDQNSNPGNAVPGNRDTYEADTDAAPSLRLEYNVQRSISGNVFEDLPINELLNQNIREGNGKLDNGEPGIPKVKVELLRKEARTNGTYGEWTLKPEYTTTTDENGSYTIKDFAAGDYVIRYTWGGKEHIVDVNKKYTAQNYKATIFDESKHNDPANKWYQGLEPRYSDAKDIYDETDKMKYTSEGILDTRETIDEDINTESIKYDKVYDETKVMVSQTNEMAIDIEYGTTNSIEEPAKDAENTDFGTSKKHTIENVDFGIIERPRQYYELIKKIDTIKVTLQNGQVLVDAKIDDDYKVTPDGTTSLTSMKPVVGGTEGYPNGLVKLEMDNELIQGATVELTYSLCVKNSSEIDYAYKAFYTYGKSGIPTNDEDKKRTATRITIEKINDYLDKEWAVNENEETFVESKWEKKTINQLEGQVDPKVLQGTDKEKTLIKDRIILQSEKLKGNSIATGEKTDLLKLTATKVLTTINNSDIELDNEAEVTQITKTGGGALTTKDGSKKIIPGNYVPGAGKKVEDDDDMAQTFTVTPNTGSNLNYVLPILIGMSALAILGVGIVWIKKLFGTGQKSSK